MSALLNINDEETPLHASDHAPIYLLTHQPWLRGDIQAGKFELLPSAEKSESQAATGPMNE